MYNDDWIIEHQLDYEDMKMLCAAYNEAFSTDINYRTFKSHLRRKLGLLSVKSFYTEEEDLFLLEYYPAHGMVETCNEFNKRFQKRRTPQSIKTRCIRLGIKVDKEVYSRNRVNNHPRTLKLGEVTTDARGYLKVKTSTGNKNNFEFLHQMNYERAYGKQKPGTHIIFLDGDKNNCDPENLMAITPRQVALLLDNDMRSECAEITRCGVAWTELCIALKERKQYGNKEK